MPTITITSCTPDSYSKNSGGNSKITFVSGDNKYYIDLGSRHADMSDQQFPLEVPAGGSVDLKLKKSIPKKTFRYKILDAQRNQCCPQVGTGPGEETPTLIVD